MPKRRISCDKFSASDLNLFVDSIEEISRLESMKHKSKQGRTTLDTEDTVSYWDLEDILSTDHTLSTIHESYDEILAKNGEEESIGCNSTCLATNQRYFVNYPRDRPSALELDGDVRNSEFDDVENALDSALELIDDDYAVSNIEWDAVNNPIKSDPELDAVPYAVHNIEFNDVGYTLDTTLSTIHESYDEILAKNGEEESIARNSTYLATNQRYFVNYPRDRPSALELDGDECDVRNNEFDDVENALDAALELIDDEYAVSNIEWDAVNNPIKYDPQLDAVPYAVHNIEFDDVGYALDTEDIDSSGCDIHNSESENAINSASELDADEYTQFDTSENDLNSASEEDMLSTNHTLSTIHESYNEILATNCVEESIGRNSTCLATNQRYFVNYPRDRLSALELDGDECDVRNIEFEDVENALDAALELIDDDYAVSNIECDAVNNPIKSNPEFDAVPYAVHNIEFDDVGYAMDTEDIDSSGCAIHNSESENAINSASELDADEYTQFDTSENDLDSASELDVHGVHNIESNAAENAINSAPELDAVAYAVHRIEFDALASNEINSTGSTASSIEITSVRRSTPQTDLDAIEYADDLSFHNNITRCLPFDCTILEQEEEYEALYSQPEPDNSHVYQELYGPLAKKKKRSKLSKLNIFGLVRKKYKQCFPSKTYEWVKSTSWTRITVV